VALDIVVLSGSETEALPASVTALPFSVKLALVATELKVGGASSTVRTTSLPVPQS